MSVELQTQRERYVGNGTARTFAFRFTIEEPEQVRVVVADASGAESVLELGTDYTVVINDADGVNLGDGSVTLAAPLADGHVLALLSAIPEDQQRSFPDNTPYYQQQVEGGIDKNTRLIQQLREDVERAVKVPVTSTKTGDELLSDVLDTAARANEYAELADMALQESAAVRDDVQTMFNGLAPIVPVLDDVVRLSPVADSIPVAAANVDSIRIVADDLRGLPLESLDLGYVKDPAEPINDHSGSVLVELIDAAADIARIAEHLDELLGIVETASTYAAEAAQSASSAMASEARIQSLEDETRELIATNYAEVLSNAH